MISKQPTNEIEWPTLITVAGVYVLYFGLIVFGGAFPAWITISLLALVFAQHSSLQHEVLHGHPFRNQNLSEALVFPAIGLFIPYLRFKDTHLQHHFDPNLTDPYDDPETNFLDLKSYQSKCALKRMILNFNNTLFGRMLIGPIIGLRFFYRTDWRLIRNGDARVLRGWIHHGVGLILVVGFFATFSTVPIWAYLLAAYGGMSILKIRTFLEHRAHDKTSARSVIVEDRGLLALLFLNNNFHSVHHAHPAIAWYRLPAFYRARADQFTRRNGGYVYKNYLSIFRQYFFSPKDSVSHPLWSLENRQSPLPSHLSRKDG